MLRLMAKMAQVVGIACLILSPVAILHWVMRLIHPPELADLVSIGNLLMLPPADLLDSLIPVLPRVMFQDEMLSSAELILAFLLTTSFSVFYSLESFFLEWDVKITNAVKLNQQQKAMTLAKNQKNVVMLSRANQFAKFLVMVEYPFGQPGSVNRYFDTFVNFQGNPVSTGGLGMSEHLLLEFTSAEKAILYAMEATRSLLVHYATLRPHEPKPAFKIVLHAVSSKQFDQTPVMVNLCRQIVRYAKPNQVVLSGPMKLAIDTLMSHRGSHLQVKIVSMGLYTLSGSDNEEVFHLLTAKQT